MTSQKLSLKQAVLGFSNTRKSLKEKFIKNYAFLYKSVAYHFYIYLLFLILFIVFKLYAYSDVLKTFFNRNVRFFTTFVCLGVSKAIDFFRVSNDCKETNFGTYFWCHKTNKYNKLNGRGDPFSKIFLKTIYLFQFMDDFIKIIERQQKNLTLALVDP